MLIFICCIGYFFNLVGFLYFDYLVRKDLKRNKKNKYKNMKIMLALFFLFPFPFLLSLIGIFMCLVNGDLK